MVMDVVQYHGDSENMTWQDGLSELCCRFHTWCDLHGLDKSALDQLTLARLHVDAVSYDFPLGPSKAYANRLLLAFCADFLRV